MLHTLLGAHSGVLLLTEVREGLIFLPPAPSMTSSSRSVFHLLARLQNQAVDNLPLFPLTLARTPDFTRFNFFKEKEMSRLSTARLSPSHMGSVQSGFEPFHPRSLV